jgi:hypothetical protein
VQGSILSVNPGQSLNLSGGAITLENATLQAPGSTITLLSGAANTLLLIALLPKSSAAVLFLALPLTAQIIIPSV